MKAGAQYLILCALLACASPARAFVPKLYEDAANGIPLQALRWPDGTNAVPMMLPLPLRAERLPGKGLQFGAWD